VVFIIKELVKKYSSGFITEGDSFIDKAKNKTVVFKMTIEQYTGKHRQPNM
jgi:hypothetical protein